MRHSDPLQLDAIRGAQHSRGLCPLGKALADLEHAFGLGRIRPVTAVERILGFQHGTGRAGGMRSLRHRLDGMRLPKIWQLRPDL